MKILHINSYYSGSKFYKNLYDQQLNNGLDIDVFVPVPTSYKRLEEDFGPYTILSANHGKYDRMLFHLKHYKIYKDIVGKYNIEKYDLVHAHSLFSNGYIAIKLNKVYGIPYVVAVRNTDINTFFKKMIHLRETGIEILQNAQQIIFLSKSSRDEVIEKYIPRHLQENILKKTASIPNGIDDFWLDNKGGVRESPGTDNLKLLYVGDINKNKNIITTVKVVKKLIERGFRVKLTVVGKVRDDSIYNEIKPLDYVEYIEPKAKEELIEIYRQNDIFVMPSIHETFGLVYAEAMSQGLPVIYTRGQGFDGQFKEGEVGFNVDCFDVEEITEKIIRIVNNYDDTSKRCIELSDKFNWDKIEIRYDNIYKKFHT